ncbi:MAG: KH domain-containing protein [Thermoplasmata archaeon]|nr:KH domain-containing protein [Thermoplasmata archaeon]
MHLRIPKERVGALIGKEGATKKRIEELTGIKLLIDSAEGDVEIDHSEAKDPAMAITVESIIKAVGRGFSPEKAVLLIEDDAVLEIMDLRDYVGKKPNHISRVKSRVIGSKGKTRRIIEELTGTHVSVFGNTVSIIGGTVQVSVARRALDMLISGSEHSTVYHFLEGNRDIIRAVQMGFD